MTLKDYLIVYQVRSGSYGIGQGNAYANDFLLTKETVEALTMKLLKQEQDRDPSADQVIILNIVPLEKIREEGVVEY